MENQYKLVSIRIEFKAYHNDTLTTLCAVGKRLGSPQIFHSADYNTGKAFRKDENCYNLNRYYPVDLSRMFDLMIITLWYQMSCKYESSNRMLRTTKQSEVNPTKLSEKSKMELLNRESAQNISTSQSNSLCKESAIKYRQYYIIQDKTNEKNHLKLHQRRGHKTSLNLMELRFIEKSSSDDTTNITEDNYDRVSAISSHSNQIDESSTDIDNCCGDHSKCIAPCSTIFTDTSINECGQGILPLTRANLSRHTRIQERIFWDKISTAQKPTGLENPLCSKSEVDWPGRKRHRMDEKSNSLMKNEKVQYPRNKSSKNSLSNPPNQHCPQESLPQQQQQLTDVATVDQDKNQDLHYHYQSYQQDNWVKLENQPTHQVFPDMCNRSLERNCSQHDQLVHHCSIPEVNESKQFAKQVNSCYSHLKSCSCSSFVINNNNNNNNGQLLILMRAFNCSTGKSNYLGENCCCMGCAKLHLVASSSAKFLSSEGYNSGEQSSGTNSSHCHIFHCAIHCNAGSPDECNYKSNDSKGLQQHFNQLSLINQHICKHTTPKINTDNNLHSYHNPTYSNIPQKENENHLTITDKNPLSNDLKVTEHCHCRCFQYINVDCQRHNSGTNRDKFSVKQQSPSFLANQKNELNLNISNWCHNIKPSNQMCYSMNKCEKVTMTENMDFQDDLDFRRNYPKTKSLVVTGRNEHMNNYMRYNRIKKDNNRNISNFEGVTMSSSNKRHKNLQMNFLKNNKKF
ncbi:hypothetical protein MN116_002439 [Schistosoma mekongi]|uniref:Uncharacterized protein n=1 Tax=Schistosoma mekongi TaxID=38744 RepID=A0AAE1ZKJ1_SCHME|nr:hypothetical protein MN116_002439 [Schistosoma mekongi]